MSSEPLVKRLDRWIRKVVALEAEGEWDGAIDGYLLALEACRLAHTQESLLFEHYFAALHALSNLYRREKQYDRFEKLLEELLLLHRQQDNQTGQAEAYELLGGLYLKQKMYAKSVVFYQRALELIPSSDLKARGLIHFKTIKPLYFLERFFEALERSLRAEATFELLPAEIAETFESVARITQKFKRKLTVLAEKYEGKVLNEKIPPFKVA